MRICMYGVVLLITIVGVSGCETTPGRFSAPIESNDPGNGGVLTSAPPPAPEPGLPLAVEQRFSDIPLPLELQQDIDRTFVFENRSLQIGRMVYTTRASTNDLAQFFIRECPAANWELESVTQSMGADIIFLKPGKRLAISIRDFGVTRGRELIITMTPETD